MSSIYGCVATSQSQNARQPSIAPRSSNTRTTCILLYLERLYLERLYLERLYLLSQCYILNLSHRDEAEWLTASSEHLEPHCSIVHVLNDGVGELPRLHNMRAENAPGGSPANCRVEQRRTESS